MAHTIQSPIHSDSLADVLERVLDKGVVIAGDVVVSLVGIELLSIKLRLLITTVDKATEMGIDWWRFDPQLSSQAAAHAAVDGPAVDVFAPKGASGGAAALGDGGMPIAPLGPLPSAPIAARAETPETAAPSADPHPLPTGPSETERELRGRIALLERRIADLGG